MSKMVSREQKEAIKEWIEVKAKRRLRVREPERWQREEKNKRKEESKGGKQQGKEENNKG